MLISLARACNRFYFNTEARRHRETNSCFSEKRNFVPPCLCVQLNVSSYLIGVIEVITPTSFAI